MESQLFKFSVAGLGAILSLGAAAQEKPNIIMICVDDMNGYGLLDQYGPIKMPYFRKIREQSVVFTNSYCASPVSSPSRAAFFSGMYPHNTGNYRNGATSWVDSEVLQEVEALPEYFKRNGYETWGRGKIFHAPIPKEREEAMFDNRPVYQGGFGPFPKEENQLAGRFWGIESFPDDEFPDVINADAAIEFLNDSHSKPFFLYYGLWRPHTPFTAPQRFFDMYSMDDITIPEGFKKNDLDDVPEPGRELSDVLNRFIISGETTPEMWKKYILGYCATNSFADWNVGRVIEALDKSPYADNTIVIVFSDNGYHCGEKNHWEKSALWHMADYVPMFIRMPDKKGALCHSPVSLVDIFPTLGELCSLDRPKQNLDGVSIISLIKRPAKTTGRAVITTFGEKYSGVTDGRYRYIRYPDGSEEFYDHKTDPYEWNNIADEKRIGKKKENLSKAIPEKWYPSIK